MPRKLLVGASRRFTWVMVAIVAVLVAALVLFYWQLAEKSDQLMAKQVKSRQQTLIKSASLGMTEFFQGRQTRLYLLAGMDSVRNLQEKEGRAIFRFLVEQAQKDQVFIGVVRVDKEGKIAWVDNTEQDRQGEGSSVADRDYFKKAAVSQHPGEVFITEPVISRAGMTKGKWVAVMGVPVFKNQSFNGLVIFSFPLRDLADKFLSSLIDDSRTKIFLANSQESILASNIVEAEGKKLADFIPAGDSLSKSMIASSAPVNVGGQEWSLWMANPYSQAVSLSFPLRLGQWQQMVFLILGITVLALVLIIIIRFAKEESFIDGFSDGFRNGHLKAKKKS